MYIPYSYRHLRRYQEIGRVLIAHGFGEFLDQMQLLPILNLPRRLLRRAPREPIGAPKRLRLAMEALGPTFVKFGQILSTRPDLLPPEYIDELSRLQDSVPPAPLDLIRQQIEKELGKEPDEIFAAFDEQPLAAASLAQVHAATLTDGTDVVVKIQRPDIGPVIEADLEILQDLAHLAQVHTPLGQIYDLDEIAEDFAYTLRAELDYRREARNADRFRQNFIDEPHLYIPQVHWEYTTSRILVLERIYGIKIDDVAALREAGYDTREIALHSARVIIKEVLEDGFFHADPHPGNFVIMPGHVIGAMDFGMVGHLDQWVKDELVRLYIVSVQMDSEGIVEQLIRMGAAHAYVDRLRLRRDISRLLTKYRGLPLREIRATEVVRDIMPLAFRHHLHFPSDLWLLGKTLGMMEGVGLQLDPDFDMFAVSEPFVRTFVRQFYAPGTVSRHLTVSARQWNDLLRDLPRYTHRILSQATEGKTRLIVALEDDNPLFKQLNRATNRLVIGLLTAAFIVGSALLIPVLNLTWPWPLITWLTIIGFGAASFLGVWLLVSIWRSG
jgi:ubiquinone biosynthesis protein